MKSEFFGGLNKKFQFLLKKYSHQQCLYVCKNTAAGYVKKKSVAPTCHCEYIKLLIYIKMVTLDLLRSI